MKLSDRIKKLEDRWFVGEDQPKVIIMTMVSGRKDPGEPIPITEFSFDGHTLSREPLESYNNFETRATNEARKHLKMKHAVPVLLANGSLESI